MSRYPKGKRIWSSKKDEAKKTFQKKKENQKKIVRKQEKLYMHKKKVRLFVVLFRFA
jgi:hypothetical protein